MVELNWILYESAAVAKPEKNLHMSHLDELPILYGYEGAEYAQELMLSNYSRLLRGALTEVNVKWDGCVSLDTVLKTNKGFLPIIEVINRVNTGEPFLVYARELASETNHFVPILKAKAEAGMKEWVTVVFENGSELSCTEDHLIYTTNRGYVKAGELTAKDDILEERSSEEDLS